MMEEVFPPGQPTVDRAGPLLPADDTNTMPCLSHSSRKNSSTALQGGEGRGRGGGGGGEGRGGEGMGGERGGRENLHSNNESTCYYKIWKRQHKTEFSLLVVLVHSSFQ